MADVTIDDKELAELRKQAAGAAKSAALAEALQGELKTAKEAAARVPALEAEVSQYKAAQVDATYAGAGITDPKVRKVFQLEFDEQAAADTGEKDLGKWLSGLQALEADKRPAHLAPFIRSQGADAGAAGAAGQQRAVGAGLPNVDKGARGVDGAPAKFTAEAIAKMSPEDFQKNFAALQGQIPGLAGFKLPGQSGQSAT